MATIVSERPAILAETRRTLTQLARREGVNPATIWRWRTKGIRGHKLDAVLIGGRWFTSDEAFARFVEATNGAEPTPLAPPASPDKPARSKRDASEKLAAAGF